MLKKIIVYVPYSKSNIIILISFYNYRWSSVITIWLSRLKSNDIKRVHIFQMNMINFDWWKCWVWSRISSTEYLSEMLASCSPVRFCFAVRKNVIYTEPAFSNKLTRFITTPKISKDDRFSNYFMSLNCMLCINYYFVIMSITLFLFLFWITG